jgi:hypothetical protein
MSERLKLYVADIEDKEDGLLWLSLVRHPATGCACKVLTVGKKYVRVFAPVVVANKPIYRKDDHLGEYNLLFLPDVVNDLVTKTAIEDRIKFDIEHQEKEAQGVKVVKSFIIDYTTDTLYSNYFGLPHGSWVMELLVPISVVNEVCGNIDIINNYKVFGNSVYFNNLGNMVNRKKVSRSGSHDFFGISISGIFTYNEVSLSDAIDIYNKIKQ